MNMKWIYFGILFMAWTSVADSNPDYVYEVQDSWNTGFTGYFEFTARRKIVDWSVKFIFSQPMISTFRCWEGVLESSTVLNGRKEFVVMHPDYKKVLKRGETHKIGFKAEYENPGEDARPPPVVIKVQGIIVYASTDQDQSIQPPIHMTTTDIIFLLNSLTDRPTEPPNNEFDPFSFVPVEVQSHNNKNDQNNHNNNNQNNNNQNNNINNNNNSNNNQNAQNHERNQIPVEGSGGAPPAPSTTQPDPSSPAGKPPRVPNRVFNRTAKYDYAAVLHKSLLFYEAQRSGRLPQNNRITWRGDSALSDRGDRNEDLSGGYYDAGDHVKFGFPMASSLTLLAWGVIEYWDAYEATGELQYALDALRWGADYIMKAHVSSYVLYGQVGNGKEDHDKWEKPEKIQGRRPVYKITKNQPGSDLAAESAAALAAVSLAVRRENGGKPNAYVSKLLQHADDLLKFATDYIGFYHQAIKDAAQYYKSTDYKDEIVWATAWMYRATGNKEFLKAAQGKYMNWALFSTPKSLRFSWDEKRPGLQMLMTQIDQTNKRGYDAYVKEYCDALRSHRGNYTRRGLLFLSDWSPLRYAANAAFVCLMAADSGIDPDVNRPWATKQIHYMLGDTGRSYVVGFGKNFPKRPHHRGSSCPPLPKGCGFGYSRSKKPNQFILQGALVGGPNYFDRFKDDRMDYRQNEVALDYNAGFQGAVAALLHQLILPKTRIARAHEPWYEIAPTQATDVTGTGASPRNFPQQAAALFALAVASWAMTFNL